MIHTDAPHMATVWIADAPRDGETDCGITIHITYDEWNSTLKHIASELLDRFVREDTPHFTPPVRFLEGGESGPFTVMTIGETDITVKGSMPAGLRGRVDELDDPRYV